MKFYPKQSRFAKTLEHHQPNYKTISTINMKN